MAEKKCPECIQKVPEYMLTYGDFITLLLVFFIALYRPSARSDAEMKLIMSSFTGSLGIFPGGQTLSPGKLEDLGMMVSTLPAQDAGHSMSKAKRIAQEIFKPEVKSRKVSVTQDERGLVISLIGTDHFAPGSARLSEETKEILAKVGNLMRQLHVPARIEGHADETPVALSPAGERYETNWELASQRAVNVLRFLHESEDVEPSKMSAVSYGMYRPVSESKSPEGRALNRRVDIVLLTAKSAGRDYKDIDLPQEKVPGVEWQTK